MVKLTQIDDETQQQFENQSVAKNNHIIDEASSEEESDDDDESDLDDFDFENETLLERIVALKDMVPPEQREAIYNLSSTLQGLFKSSVQNGGKFLWTLTSSSLLLGVPLALAILSETQLQEMERGMSLEKSAQDVLAPGSEAAFGNENKK
ncbi:mitochondrial import receptor subunit, putative [Candida dubliniensis CD36]|uniref:Mitochondrial import receptor subunit, putative n=1 Tax=Candida dubliniensis (strain CD36 / ATCC MYA-646 / CBS 7987 / NCPF 3949 / NRRL Y-17841) TaxID=573826 RepID=B9WKE0_CANDC|nr:mitochondrial import receptor subunit, putative [Candida dubliniensis CD36]CAX40790.1 mitochondrial import receptor subunit, putative [Candida dubliniensis CD36]